MASSRGNGDDWVVLFNGNDGLTDPIRNTLRMDIDAAIDEFA